MKNENCFAVFYFSFKVMKNFVIDTFPFLKSQFIYEIDL